MGQMISVIVPVYNCKEYLANCIESILNQTYPQIQLVLVDDGSSDGSGEICDRYAAQDARLLVSHQENGGVSKARNAGLETAAGEWVLFVDADDYVEPSYCQSMLDAAMQCDADVVIARPSAQDQPGLQRYEAAQIEQLKQSCLAYEEARYDYNIDAPWGKIFRRSLIETHRIRFPEDLSRSEDALFCATVYEHAASIGCLNRFGYVHVEREGSLCRRFAPDAPEMLEKILDQNRRWVQKYHPGEKDYEKALWYRALPGIDECEKTCFLHESNLDSRWIRMKKYDHFLRHGLVGYAIRQLKSKDILKPQYRIRLRIYQLHLGWLFLWLKMLR